jgi:hypothetical protein
MCPDVLNIAPYIEDSYLVSSPHHHLFGGISRPLEAT